MAPVSELLGCPKLRHPWSLGSGGSCRNHEVFLLNANEGEPAFLNPQQKSLVLLVSLSLKYSLASGQLND